MLFVDSEGEGVEIESSRPRASIDRDPDQVRRLRDRALWFLKRAGLSWTDLETIIEAFINEPIGSRRDLRERVKRAEEWAEQEVNCRG